MYLMLNIKTSKNTNNCHGCLAGNSPPRVDVTPYYWLLPDEFDTLEASCMVLLQNNNKRTRWHWDPCWSFHGYICEIGMLCFKKYQSYIKYLAVEFMLTVCSVHLSNRYCCKKYIDLYNKHTL